MRRHFAQSIPDSSTCTVAILSSKPSERSSGRHCDICIIIRNPRKADIHMFHVPTNFSIVRWLQASAPPGVVSAYSTPMNRPLAKTVGEPYESAPATLSIHPIYASYGRTHSSQSVAVAAPISPLLFSWLPSPRCPLLTLHLWLRQPQFNRLREGGSTLMLLRVCRLRATLPAIPCGVRLFGRELHL